MINEPNESNSMHNNNIFVNKCGYLFENISYLFLLQASYYIFPLITLPYLVRVLSPDKFGLMVFAQAFMMYFIILTDYGFNLTATRQIALEKKSRKRISEIFSTVMLIKVFLLLIGFLVVTIVILTIPKFNKDWHIYYAAYLMVIGNVLFPLWLFQGMEKMKYITVLNVCARGVATAAIFLFIKNEADYILATLILSSGWIIAGISGIVVSKIIFKIYFIKPAWDTTKILLTEGWYVFISTGAATLYTSSNLFVLGLFTNNVTVGYYGAAEKIVKAVQGLVSPVSQAIYPHISSLVLESKEKAIAFIRKSLRWISLGTFVMSSILFIFADMIVSVAFGDEYLKSAILIKLMAFLPFVVALSNVFGIQTMLTFGMTKTFSRILMSGAVLNLIIVFPMIHYWDASGAAFSVLITEIFVTLIMFIVINRNKYSLISIKE